MKRPRQLGNDRESIVVALFAERGRYAVTLRGSGSRGRRQAALPMQVAGDVVCLPMCRAFTHRNGDRYEFLAPGIQVEVGGAGKRFDAAFAALRAGAVPGYALVVCIFAGRKPRRWLLGDANGGWTECDDCSDLLATVEARG